MIDLLREACVNRVTYISIDTSGGIAKVGAWKARGRYYTARHADPAVALEMALHKAMAPTDLSELFE